MSIVRVLIDLIEWLRDNGRKALVVYNVYAFMLTMAAETRMFPECAALGIATFTGCVLLGRSAIRSFTDYEVIGQPFDLFLGFFKGAVALFSLFGSVMSFVLGR